MQTTNSPAFCKACHLGITSIVKMSSQEIERAISSTQTNPEYLPVWLDALPLDICARIASFFPRYPLTPANRSQHLPDTLALAAVSPVQKLAISSSHSHNLSIFYSNSMEHTSELIRYWTDIVDHVSEIRLPFDFSDTENARNLLSLPSIKKADIPSRALLLRSLHTGGSVQSLELTIDLYCFQLHQDELKVGISNILHKCPIEELRIICKQCTVPLQRVCFMSNMPDQMKQKCASLRLLYLRCTSEHMQPLLTVPAMFPNLEEFRLEHWLSANRSSFTRTVELDITEVYEQLKGLKRVEMINCGRVGTFIPFGSNLFGLRSIVEVPIEDVTSLSTCCNLRSLDIILAEGADVCFPESLCNLRNVSLTWNPFDRPLLEELYYAPLPEFFPALVQRNKNIVELRLKNVLITSSSLESVLSTLGDKLQELYVPIFHQHESPSRRFSRLSRLIVTHNTGLHNLEICESSYDTIAHLPVMIDHESEECDPNNCEYCELRKRIQGALSVLKRRILRFCDNGIRVVLSSLQPWRKEMGWGSDDVMDSL